MANTSSVSGIDKRWNAERASTPLREAIRCRAFELYESRGKQDGRELEDWLRAEKEVMKRKAGDTAQPD